MNGVVEGLFSFKGRMPRGEAWLLLVGISLAAGGLLSVGSMIVLATMAPEAAEDLAPVHRMAKSLVQLVILWPTLAILSKRGHDRNRPVTVTIGLWLASLAFSAISLAAQLPLLALGTLVIWIYLLIDYGLLDGTPGPNRYGPSPKGPSATPIPKVDFGPSDPI